MKVLVSGAAGFIGSFTSHKLLDRSDEVVGVDNLNDYYDVSLKKDRLSKLKAKEGFSFHHLDISDSVGMRTLFANEKPDRVVHLAAQAGVRYSLENPLAYVNSNLVGFVNVLEASRHEGIDHLVYASTSSVYGANTDMPFRVDASADHPLSLYAATKKSNELIAHSYSHLFRIPTTGLRFFTVYGPWGRPDMALFKFTRNILAGEPIDVFNYGKHTRDFTYIDDIVEGIVRILDKAASPDPNWRGKTPNPSSSTAPYRIYNIGSNDPQELTKYIDVLEQALGRKAKKNLQGLQPGDVPDTYANVDELMRDIAYIPRTSIEAGIQRFVDWYLNYYVNT